MNLIIRTPDDFAHRLASNGSNPQRKALEALAPEQYRCGRRDRHST